MTARNDITGDAIASRTTTDSYRKNFDAIFRTPPAVREAQQRLTDLAQTEPGYSGWSRIPDCNGSCHSGEECRCKA